MSVTIHFIKDSPNSFFPVLNERVKKYLAGTKENNLIPAIKFFCFTLAYFGVYLLFYFTERTSILLLLYILLGFITTIIAINIFHDAAHNAYFTKPSLNRVAFLWMDFFGTDGDLWKRRHLLHHAYANIPGHDMELSMSDIVRIMPDSPYRWFHRFQKYYTPILYLVYTMFWFFVRDIRDIVHNNHKLRLSKSRKIRIVLKKFQAIVIFIILPVLLGPFTSGWYIAGFVCMHFSMSILAILIVTSAHVNDTTEFPKPDENGKIFSTYAEHQLKVTHDFGANSLFFSFLMGGFNLHVAHHLFPSIASRHYPAITKIIRQTAAEFNLPYSSNGIIEGILAHARLIRNNSYPLNEIEI